MALAVAAILAMAGFALVYVPWYDKRMLVHAMRSMLDGAVVGAFAGGLLGAALGGETWLR